MLNLLADRIRAMGTAQWLLVFGLILAAWAALFVLAVPADLRSVAQLYGSDFWDALCTVTLDGAGYANAALMWALMAAAMMLPSALPAFATHDDLGRQTGVPFLPLVLGYGCVWIGFALTAAALQLALYRFGLISAIGDSLSDWLTAGLLLGAGLYQFSPVKEACLAKCRRPLTFFMQHWDEGPWRNGVRLGLVCLGCCWALMLLAFVGGVMNLAFMGVATLIMVGEKMDSPDFWGVSRPAARGLERK
jgi:predicted metal-binding membrane protein